MRGRLSVRTDPARPAGGGRHWLIPVLLAIWFALGVWGCGRVPDTANSGLPQRILCASPAVAEMAFALGAGDRVVGVSDFTDWPLEAAALPRIGGALAPSRERILALQPDLILAQGRAEALTGFAHTQGIPILSLPLDTIDDVRAAILGFAAVLGHVEQGQHLLNEMEAGFAAIPRVEPVSVFIALGHAPGDFSGLMTAGSGTYLNKIVYLAGGRNVFAESGLPWPTVSKETLIRRAPAIVLDIQSPPLDESHRQSLRTDWERLGFRADQVRILEEDTLLRPGPRAAMAAARVAEILGTVNP